jgi:polyisoprenyl-phosphate glycosyltransferase
MPQRILEIAVPVFNEEEGIAYFLQALEKETAPLTKSFLVHFLFVNDASTDNTAKIIREFPFQTAHSVRMVHLKTNVGHSSAINACVQEFKGDALVLMDSDMQDDPTLLQELIRSWENGAPLVRVRRENRNDGVWRNICFALFYKLFELLSGLPAGMGTYGLYSADIVKKIRQNPEHSFFLPGLVSSLQIPAFVIRANRPARRFGKSKMGFWRLFKLASIALFAFSPLGRWLNTRFPSIYSVQKVEQLFLTNPSIC